MIIPKELKVGTVKYKVKYGKVKGFGRLNFKHNEITISTTLNPQFHGGSFLHEIVECLDQQFSMGLRHEQIGMLAETLYTVLTENNLLKEK